jgi:hypothetical protein
VAQYLRIALAHFFQVGVRGFAIRRREFETNVFNAVIHSTDQNGDYLRKLENRYVGLRFKIR